MGSSTNTSNQHNKHGSVGKKLTKSGHNKASNVGDGKEFIEHFSSMNGIYRKTLDSRVNEVTENENRVEKSKVEARTIQNNNQMDRDSPVPLCEWGNDKENLQWFSKGKARSSLKESSRWSKLSLQSLTELESVDGFVGPFSWKTRSLQDMSFPHLDDQEEAENRSGARQCKELTNHYFTMDGLREKLKRDYLEAQEQREKYRHMLSSGGSKCIQRTEESVEFIARNIGPGRSFKTPRNRFPLSSLGNNVEGPSKFQFSPFKKKATFEEPSHSKWNNGIANHSILNEDFHSELQEAGSSDSESEKPEVRLTVKQISEDLDKVLFKTKSPLVSPTAPTTDDVIDFLKNW